MGGGWWEVTSSCAEYNCNCDVYTTCRIGYFQTLHYFTLCQCYISFCKMAVIVWLLVSPTTSVHPASNTLSQLSHGVFFTASKYKIPPNPCNACDLQQNIFTQSQSTLLRLVQLQFSHSSPCGWKYALFVEFQWRGLGCEAEGDKPRIRSIGLWLHICVAFEKKLLDGGEVGMRIRWEAEKGKGGMWWKVVGRGSGDFARSSYLLLYASVQFCFFVWLCLISNSPHF